MGYESALIAAGADIKVFKEFGSYQGDWFAILNNGNVVHGAYGSCSGCDAFQAEFDYDDKDEEKLAAFGKSYLCEQQSISELVESYQKKATAEYAWGDDKEILEWLLANFPEAARVSHTMKRYDGD